MLLRCKNKKEHFVMSVTIKTKICWNCETIVTPYDENCSFCGVYLSPSTDDDKEDLYNILTPPYRMVKSQEDTENEDVNLTSFNEEASNSESLDHLPISNKLVITTIVFLILGSIFLLFAAMMLVFSQDGFLTMRWNADYWYVYLSLALPFLFIGWKCLHKI